MQHVIHCDTLRGWNATMRQNRIRKSFRYCIMLIRTRHFKTSKTKIGGCDESRGWMRRWHPGGSTTFSPHEDEVIHVSVRLFRPPFRPPFRAPFRPLVRPSLRPSMYVSIRPLGKTIVFQNGTYGVCTTELPSMLCIYCVEMKMVQKRVEHEWKHWIKMHFAMKW